MILQNKTGIPYFAAVYANHRIIYTSIKSQVNEMFKLMKRMIAVAGIVCCTLSMTLVPIYADEQYTEGPLIYTIEDGGIIIIGYFGDQTTVTVPEQIAGIPVFKIAENAFVNTTVKELILPDSIMSIESNAVSSDIKVTYQWVDNESETQTAEPAGSDTEYASETENSESTIGESGYEDEFGKESDAGEIDLDAEIENEEQSSSPTSSGQSKTSQSKDKTENTVSQGSGAGLLIGAGVCLAVLAGVFLFARKKK